MPVERPADIPGAPGVYEFVDGDGHTLYIGKAKQLSRRLTSYFNDSVHPRTRRLLAEAASVRWVVCASETEALVLEREWIHTKQPPYNIRLRAGSGYQGLAVTRDPVPRVVLWRGRRPDGADTFGPYPGVPGRDLLDAVSLVFGVRTCDDATYRQAAGAGRMCLLGETGKCLGPCTGNASLAVHADAADRLRRHLSRPDGRLGRRYADEMARFAEDENFEAAARRRDQLRALDVITQRQRIVAGTGWSRRAVVVRRDGTTLVVADVATSDGVITRVDLHFSDDDPEIDDRDTLEAVLVQIGGQRNGPVIGEHATSGSRAARGRRERDLVAFAAGQADEALRNPGARSRRHDPVRLEQARQGLQDLLGAGRDLRRIECIDISHRAGTHAVGSLVVYVDGEPRPSQYRTVNLGDTGGDDYAAIAETVRRRFGGNQMGLDANPDLLLIDGGAGQLAAARDALDAVGATDRLVLASLAKRFEEVHLPNRTPPLRLAADDPALLLLTAIRDAAHDNGVRAHRRQRERAALSTGLDGVKGLGAAKRKALLERFSTFDAVAAAPVEEIAQVHGIGLRLAERIHEAFHPQDTPQ